MADMDRDEIIMSLTEIVDQPTEDGVVDGVNQQTIKGALELLKEQRPKPVKFSENAYGHKTYYCPKCGRWFEFCKQAYCDKCGQAVKWE